jgi:hypothetical protein
MRDTIDMAREVYGAHTEWKGAPLNRLKQFEALVRADEREACAKVCDSLEEQCEKLGLPDEKWPTPADCAFVIRARGNT